MWLLCSITGGVDELMETHFLVILCKIQVAKRLQISVANAEEETLNVWLFNLSDWTHDKKHILDHSQVPAHTHRCTQRRHISLKQFLAILREMHLVFFILFNFI